MHVADESSELDPNVDPDNPPFRLRGPPFFSLLVVVMLVAAPVGMLIPWLRDALSGRPWLPGLTFIIGATTLFTGIVLGLRMLVRPKAAPVIRLGASDVLLPLSSGSRRSRRVPYEHITSLNTFGKGRWARLLIATKGRNFVYPVAHFDGGAVTLDAIRRALHKNIADQPGGMELLRAIQTRDARGSSIAGRPSRVTLALLALLVGIFAWTWLWGALDDPFGLVAFGANSPALVTRGEWYRLLAANFLHSGWLHLYMNGIGVYVLGMLLERLVGPWRFVLIFLTSAAAGAAASLLVSDAALSVGASTAVFGLLGAHAFINWRYRATLPGGFGQPLRTWLIILGINAALPFIVPIIDWAAHVGGFVAGAAAAAAMSRGTNADEFGASASPGLKATTVGLAAVYVGALGQAFAGAFDETHIGRLSVAESFVKQESARSSTLNSIAWHYAIKPDVTAAELDISERAALRAVELAPGDSAPLDTLATVYYRRGRFDDAVETQRQAVWIDDGAMLVSQMGRFLDAYAAQHGPYTLGDFAPDGIDVRLDVLGGEEGVALIVNLATPIDQEGLEVYALDQQGGRLRGVIRLLAGSDLRAGPHRLPVPKWTGPPDEQSYAVVYVDATGCECPRGGFRFRYFPFSREVGQLPGAL